MLYLRKLDRLLVASIAISSVSGATPSRTVTIAPDPPAPAASSVPIVRGTCVDDESAAHFTIAHFNDLQAHYGALASGRSRYGYIAGVLRGIQQEQPSTLVVDAGDDYEKGSIADLRSFGEATRQMVQALPIDVRTIGNHDFAYGENALLRDVSMSAHPVLAANVHYADGRSPFLPYVAARVGCVRVGIVGLVAGHYGSSDQLDGGSFDGVFLHDDHYVRLVREQVERHHDEVDVMMALTHIGLAADLDIVAQVPDIDIVVGGHTEDFLKDGWPVIRRDGRMAWVLQAGHYGEHVGRADFVLDKRSHALRLQRYAMSDVDTSLPYAEDVGAKAHALEAAFAPDTDTPIALLRDAIEPQDMPKVLARAVRDRWAIDALFVGRDLFWTGLPSGPITLQRLLDASPVQREPSGTPGFTSLWVVMIRGSDLVDVKQRSFSGYVTVLPDAIVPDRVYRLALDKRALEHPGMVGTGLSFSPDARFAGEVVDVLEAYARARTSQGMTL